MNKTKRVLSFVTSFAMAASAFSALVIPASAEETLQATYTKSASGYSNSGGSIIVNKDTSSTTPVTFNTSANGDWKGVAVLEFELPAVDPSRITDVTLNVSLHNTGNRGGTRTYDIYKSTGITIDENLTDYSTVLNSLGDLIYTQSNGLLDGAYRNDSISDVDALTSYVKETISAESETSIQLAFSNAAQMFEILLAHDENLENSAAPTLALTLANEGSTPCNVTINYVDQDSETFKTDNETVFSGTEFTPEYDNVIYDYENGFKYTYVSGGESQTINDDATITLTYNKEELKEYTVDVNAIGDVTQDITEVTGMEAQDVTYYVPKYIVQDGIAYETEANSSGAYYGATINAIDSSQTVEKTYTKAYENVVFFEDLDDTSAQNANLRASNGLAYDNKAYESEEEIQPGTYTMVIRIQDRGRGSTLTIGDQTVYTYDGTTRNAWRDVTVSDITVETAGKLALNAGGSGTYDDLDTIVIYSNTAVEPDPTPSETTVPSTPAPEFESKTIYTADFSGESNRVITTLAPDGGSATDINACDVVDFGETIPALDGWGYMHYGYADGLTSSRQSSAGIVAASNAVYVQGVGNSGSNGAVSFIPANVADIEIPETGAIIYTFDASVETTGGNQSGNINFGLTTGAGNAPTSAGSITMATTGVNNEVTTSKLVMVNDLDNDMYYIYKDGILAASGSVMAPITGIFVQTASSRYIKGTIANLTVAAANRVPDAVKVTFVGDEGAILQEYESVLSGTALNAPEAPVISGKTFKEWQNSEGTAVTEFTAGETDTVYTAVYEEGSTVSTVNVTTNPYAKIDLGKDGETTTLYADANGVAAFESIAQGDYSYTISKTGYSSKTGTFTLGIENYSLSETLAFDEAHADYIYYETDFANGAGSTGVAASDRGGTFSFGSMSELPNVYQFSITLNASRDEESHYTFLFKNSDGGVIAGLQGQTGTGLMAFTGWNGSSAPNQSGDLNAFTNGVLVSNTTSGSDVTLNFVVDRANNAITVSCGTMSASLPFTVDASNLSTIEFGKYRTAAEVLVTELSVSTPDATFMSISGDTDIAKVSGQTVTRTYSRTETVITPDETFTWTVTPADAGVTIADGVLSVADTATPGQYTIKAEGSTGKSAELDITVADFSTVTATVDGPKSYEVGQTGTYAVTSLTDTCNDDVLALFAPSFASDNTDVITIDPLTGVATAVAAGTANIIVTIGNPGIETNVTIPVVVDSYYVVADATGNSTNVDLTPIIGKGNGTYQVTTSLDGVLVRQYTVTSEDLTTITSNVLADDAIEYTATYDVNGLLTGITAANVSAGTTPKDIPAVDGVKIFYWDENMTPVGTTTAEVENGLVVDTTGADKVEVAPVYSAAVDQEIIVPNATYNVTVSLNSNSRRTDIYVNDQLIINNMNQGSDNWTIGRDTSAGTTKEAGDVVIAEGYAVFNLRDNAGASVNTITFVKAPSIVDRAQRIYVIGDSLVADYYGVAPAGQEALVRTGWGQVLDSYIVDNVNVTNLGNSGAWATGMRSDAFTNVLKSAQPGDIMILESGYNDRSHSTDEEMREAVTDMITTAYEMGLTTFLVTPNASAHDYSGSVVWSAAIREVATGLSDKTTLIDLSQQSYDFLNSRYGSNTDTLIAYYNNSGDTLHSSTNAANCWAAIVAQGLADNGFADIVDTEYSYHFDDGTADGVTVQVTAD